MIIYGGASSKCFREELPDSFSLILRASLILSTAITLFVLIALPAQAQESTTGESTVGVEESNSGTAAEAGNVAAEVGSDHSVGTTGDIDQQRNLPSNQEANSKVDESVTRPAKQGSTVPQNQGSSQNQEDGRSVPHNDSDLKWAFQQHAPEDLLEGFQESPIEDPLAGEVAILSDNNDDRIVDLITIPRGGCTVGKSASITLQDEDGTTGDFVNGGNVILSATDNEVLAKGPEPDEENEGIVPTNVRGGNGDLDTENLEVSSSEGIECSFGSTPPLPTGCAQFEGDSTISETVPAIVNIGASSISIPLRIVYATSSESGSLAITVAPRGGGEPIVDEIIQGEKRGVINTELEADTAYQARLVPDTQGYTVVFEGAPGTGEDPCTNPEDLAVPTAPSDDVIDDVDDDELPDTGGMPIVAFAGLMLFGIGLAIRWMTTFLGR